jgi:hypothetical protein
MAKRRRSKKPTSAAKKCISAEISKHCAKGARKCKNARKRKQAVAISFAVCRRKGYRSIPAAPR